MNILILQASPRANGNTAWMAEEYKNAAEGSQSDAGQRLEEEDCRLSGLRVLPWEGQRRLHPEGRHAGTLSPDG